MTDERDRVSLTLGRYRFRNLAVGSYFFFMPTSVPCLKVDEEHCVEGGAAVHREVGGDVRVVPIEFVRAAEPPNGTGAVTGVKIGIYTVPLPSEG